MNPLMLWDGDCGFCARWIEKWKKQTGDKIQYLPYQSFEADENGRLKNFPEVSVRDCQESVQLITPDGRRFSAAAAVFYSLYSADRRKYLWHLYKNLPGFKFVSELAYKFVARHRGGF